MTPEQIDKLSEMMSQAHTGTIAILREMCKENLRLKAENDSFRLNHDKTHQMIDRIHAALDCNPPLSSVDRANALDEMRDKIIAILDEE